MTWTPPHHDPSAELRDHLTPDEWRVAILEIGARHGLDGSLAAPFATGSDIVWGLGESVIKLTAPLWTEEIEAESSCLGHVHGKVGVRTPEVLATGEIASWPYIVMTRIPGEAIGDLWPALGHPARLRLARDLGGLVRELHGVEIAPGSHGWDEFWSACRSDISRRHAKDGVPPALVDEIEPFLHSVGPLPCDSRVLLHTEILHQHLLVEERDGRIELCGLIDFADGRVGPREYEFPAPVEFLFKGEEGLLRTFLLAYGFRAEDLTPELSTRMLAWGLCHRFGHLARMLRAVEPTRPASLSELARLLYGFDPS